MNACAYLSSMYGCEPNSRFAVSSAATICCLCGPGQALDFTIDLWLWYSAARQRIYLYISFSPHQLAEGTCLLWLPERSDLFSSLLICLL